MRPLNVLLVVWDACRLDAAKEYAPTLTDLAADNLRFKNAITPAGYSLPAHLSMFTGEYPHEHGVYSQEHTIRHQPLLAELGEKGYRRYAVSANGFASPMYGFDRGFDRFYNTQGQIMYPEGLDVHAYAAQLRGESGTADMANVGGFDLLRTVVGHDHPVKSALNVTAAAVTQITSRHPGLERIPHRRFSSMSEFCYDPNRNTQTIETVLAEHASEAGDDPFFIFTNYMDPHHPYAPPPEYHRNQCGRTVPRRELRELADVTHPLRFLQRQAKGETVDEIILETVRQLYAGEIARVDAHLDRLLAALSAHDVLENTLVVVTADHGENLGETDALGETRFGHILSASDNLLRVPLVIAHPELDGRDIDAYVSLKDLYYLCTAPQRLLESGGRMLGPIDHDGPVAAEVPAYLNEVLWETYPELRELLARSMSVAYDDGWKVVATSAGDERVFRDGREYPPEEAPAAIREAARENLQALPDEDVTGHGLSQEAVSHLRALGYV